MQLELGTQAGSSAGVDVIRLAGGLSLEMVHDFISDSGWIDLLPVCASVKSRDLPRQYVENRPAVDCGWFVAVRGISRGKSRMKSLSAGAPSPTKDKTC